MAGRAILRPRVGGLLARAAKLGPIATTPGMRPPGRPSLVDLPQSWCRSDRPVNSTVSLVSGVLSSRCTNSSRSKISSLLP